MNPTENDPVIDEVREIRHQISEGLDHDPSRLVAYYIGLQEGLRQRLLPPPGEDSGTSRSAA